MTLAKVRSKCLVAAQLLARIAAADEDGYVECVSCGVIKHYRDGIHGGHFIPKGKGGGNRFALDLTNIHPQCVGCNMYGMSRGKAAQQYTMWMYDYYGKDYVDEMLNATNIVNKMTLPEYEDILKEYQELIRYHENRIGV